jgi:hypothetical protein
VNRRIKYKLGHGFGREMLRRAWHIFKFPSDCRSKAGNMNEKYMHKSSAQVISDGQSRPTAHLTARSNSNK